MRYRLGCFLLLVTCWAISPLRVAFAAEITFAGFTEGTEVSDWLTSSTPKSYDIDGDNRYGSTVGAVHWGVVGYREYPAGSTSLGWSYQGETTFGQFRNPSYANIDDLNNPAAKSAAGIGAVQYPGVFTFELTGTTADYLGKKVRVGVMADVLTQPEWMADNSKTFQVVQSVGGSGDSGIIDLRGGEAGDGVPEMYFFDLTGVNAGDRFQVLANGAAGAQPGYIGPVSWDVATIPEPTTFLMGLIALVLVACRRPRLG